MKRTMMHALGRDPTALAAPPAEGRSHAGRKPSRRVLSGAAALALLALAGCRSAQVQTAEGPLPQAGPPVSTAEVPAGTLLEVQLNETLSTDGSHVGDAFTATLEQPVVSAGGVEMVPRGAVVHGRVTGIHHSESVGDPAAIRVAFERLTFRDRSLPLRAAVLRTEIAARDDVDLRDLARKAGVGAAAGAALGAILTGDLERTIAAAMVGAGVGTLISLGTGDVEAALPAGTDMSLQTTQVIRLR